MAHNENEINAEALFELLRSISKFFEKDINMYALGGTALTILNIKPSTKDVDINIEKSEDYEYTTKIFEQIGFEQRGGVRWITQEGLAFDLFYGSNILGTELLDDCIEKSSYISSFGKIKLHTIPLEDIIISKLARGDLRDFDDIKSIFKNKKIDVKNLAKRYRETMETSIVSNYKQKLLDLIQIKFKKWGFDIDLKLIGEVKKWEI